MVATTVTGHRPPVRRLPAIVLGAAALVWYLVLAVVVVSRLFPLFTGWSPVVITSGSMEPLIAAGDIVVYEPTDGLGLGPGTVITFESPADPERLITHRIEIVNTDGSYVTRGDANRRADSSPVRGEQVVGVGRMVVPYAGLPLVWLAGGEWPLLMVFVALLFGSRVVMSWFEARATRDPIGSAVRGGDHRLCRVVARWGPAGAALLLVASVALSGAAFSDSSSNGGNGWQAAASFSPIQFVQEVGTASCQDTTSTVVVAAGGVASGDTVIVRVVLRNADPTAPVTATDTQGNGYSVDGDVARSTRIRTVVLSAHVGAGLGPGDTITVSHPDGQAESVAVEEFSGIASSSRVDDVATAQGRTTSASTAVSTTAADTLLYGVVGVRGTTSHGYPAGWMQLRLDQVVCGTRRLDSSASYQVVDIAGSYTYTETFSNRRHWAEVLVAYRAA